MRGEPLKWPQPSHHGPAARQRTRQLHIYLAALRGSASFMSLSCSCTMGLTSPRLYSTSITVSQRLCQEGSSQDSCCCCGMSPAGRSAPGHQARKLRVHRGFSHYMCCCMVKVSPAESSVGTLKQGCWTFCQGKTWPGPLSLWGHRLRRADPQTCPGRASSSMGWHLHCCSRRHDRRVPAGIQCQCARVLAPNIRHLKQSMPSCQW